MRRYWRAAYACGAVLTLAWLFGADKVQAASNVGPDPDFIYSSNQYGMSFGQNVPRTFDYVITNDDSAPIPSTRIKIYMPTSSGTITITNPDVCYNYRTIPANPSYYVQWDPVDTLSSGEVSRFQISNTEGISRSQSGYYNGSSSCFDRTLSFQVSGSKIDAGTGMYPYFLTAYAVPNGDFSNIFGVRAPAGAIVTADATQSPQSFGMRNTSPITTGRTIDGVDQSRNPPHPYQNFNTWEMPFAADCSVDGASTQRAVEFFDDDNFGGDGAQILPFSTQMREYDRNGNFVRVIRPDYVRWTKRGAWGPSYTSPAHDSGGGWETKTYNGEQYEFISTGSSMQNIQAFYTFRSDRIYRMRLLSVYYMNTLQFKLPFESTYYYRPCQLASLGAQINVLGNDAYGPTIYSGQTYTLHATAINDGWEPSSKPGYLEVAVTRGSPTGAPFPLGAGSSAAGDPPRTSSSGYRPDSKLEATGQNGTSRFYWEYPQGFAPDTTSQPPGGLTFQVPANTPSGTVICFTAYASRDAKGKYGGGPESASAVKCYTVQNPRYPGIQAYNSDVHAGGGLGACKSVPVTGNVLTLPLSNSTEEYVVAASGSISGLKSNGTSSGDSLKLGNGGSYAQVCRPDLFKVATAYRTSKADKIFFDSGSTFNVGGKSGIYYLDAPNVNVSGTVTDKLTIVASGTITINGAITLAGRASTRNETPSLGIIAHGDIYINANVSRVDAYLFSDAAIDTCKLGTGSCASPGTLFVNGFLMAKTLSFHRLGPAGTSNAQVAENIVLNPQLYLNPPRLFDIMADNTLLMGQGERRPLF